LGRKSDPYRCYRVAFKRSFYLSIIIVKKGDNKVAIQKMLEKLDKNEKGLDTKKYCGKIHLDVDPIEYQKKIRNEWE
jgi:hypothetical protein